MAKKSRRWWIVALVLVALPAVAWLALPWPVAYRWVDPAATAVMRYRMDQAEADGDTLFTLRQEWVPLERISDGMVRAVIAAEDGRFREHGGIDWFALADELRWQGDDSFSWRDADDRAALVEALRYYRDNRDEVRGRSTITQQLAKNLYFTPERSLGRKVAELFIARRLEAVTSKERILELYLNTVELGPGLFGVEAAAREYFGVSAAELTTFQSASLAATLPHPLTSNPDYRPSRMAWRRDLIVQRLRGGGGEGSIPVAPEPVAVPDIQIEVPDLSSGEPEPAAEPEQAEEPPPDPTDPTGGGEPAPEPPPAEPAVPDTLGMAIAPFAAPTRTEGPWKISTIT
jgi:monofunctional biosynthetic peptidoglycan transglycosylase